MVDNIDSPRKFMYPTRGCLTGVAVEEKIGEVKDSCGLC